MADTNKVITDLHLGITQEEFLKNTKTHLETLYDENTAQGEAIVAAQNQADEALNLAQGKNKAKSFDTLFDMVEAVRLYPKTELSVGDSLFIVETDVPDFWVTTVSDTQVTDVAISTLQLNNYGPTQVGYFTISKLETQKVIIDRMVESDADLTTDKIIVGDEKREGSKSPRKVKSTSYSINTSELNATSVPIGSVVQTALNDKVDKVGGKGLSTNDFTNDYKDKVDDSVSSATLTTELAKYVPNTRTVNGQALSQDIVVSKHRGTYAASTTYYIGDIVTYSNRVYSCKVKHTSTSTFATANWELIGYLAEPSSTVDKGLFTYEEKQKLAKFVINDKGNLTYDGAEIGKVKDVKVNGASVLDEEGIANIVINIDDLTATYENIELQSISINGVSYKAIVVADTNVSLEVLNSDGHAVITQVIRANGNINYCFPTTATGTYTLRKVGGNTVGGGGLIPTSVTLSQLQSMIPNLPEGTLVSFLDNYGHIGYRSVIGMIVNHGYNEAEFYIPSYDGVAHILISNSRVQGTTYEITTGDETELDTTQFEDFRFFVYN